MLSSRGLKLLRAVGIGSIGSVTLLKSIGALMLGLDLDCDVHGRDSLAKLELRDRLLGDTS
jgi:hypothetical protein